MIVITGGGFIGSAIKQRLSDQAIVISKSDKPGFVTYDLTNDVSVKELIKRLPNNITCIVHTAAVTPWSGNTNYDDDLLMAKTVAKICNELRIPKLIYISGWNVYDMSGHAPFDEQTQLGASDEYGQSKQRIEEFLKDNLVETKSICLRTASIFGPGQSSAGLIPNLTSAALSGNTMTIEHAATKRDYMYIDDFATAIENVVKRIDESCVINIGSGHSQPVEAVAETIRAAAEKLTGKSVNVVIKSTDQSTPADNCLDISLAKQKEVLRQQATFEHGIYEYVKWRQREDLH